MKTKLTLNESAEIIKVYFNFCNENNLQTSITDVVRESGVSRSYVYKIINKFNLRNGVHGSRKLIRYVVDNETGCWIWQLSTVNGYAEDPTNKTHTKLVHVINYEEKYGPVPDGKILDHLCRVRHCVNPDHLEPVTYAENSRRGNGTKLTIEIVREIRRLFATKSYDTLAKKFNVGKSTIWRIVNNESWKEE